VNAVEEKLCENNLDAIIVYLDGLEVLRNNGGYGGLDMKVKDGLVTVENIIISKHIPAPQKSTYRA
jgi:hypothetical protein